MVDEWVNFSKPWPLALQMMTLLSAPPDANLVPSCVNDRQYTASCRNVGYYSAGVNLFYPVSIGDQLAWLRTMCPLRAWIGLPSRS